MNERKIQALKQMVADAIRYRASSLDNGVDDTVLAASGAVDRFFESADGTCCDCAYSIMTGHVT